MPQPTPSLLTVFFLVLAPAASLFAQQGWDGDDFLISGFLSNNVAVFDADLSFKGHLDPGFVNPTGLDFLPGGGLLATAYSLEVREYSPSGAALFGFSDPDLGAPADLKAGGLLLDVRGEPLQLVYVATQDGALRVREFDMNGVSRRSMGNVRGSSLAMLPGNRLWAGGFGERIEMLNAGTGRRVASIVYDNGQLSAVSMTYSAASDTVLLADWVTGKVFERARSGAFVRVFVAPMALRPIGVTRGPGGDVLAVDFARDSVFRWRADGVFVSETPLGVVVDGPFGLVWAGNSAAAAAPAAGR